MPGVGDAIILLIACFLAMMSVGSYLQVHFPAFGVLGNQLIFAGFSLFLAWYMKCDFKKVFSFRKPKGNLFLALISSVLLWAGTYLIMLCMIVPLEQLFPESRQNLGNVEELMNSMSPVMLIIGVGIAPAICEEILFRGFLFGAFRERFKTLPAVLITAGLFGLYHMSLVKFFTTGAVGLTQGAVLGLTGSIFLPMLLHAINNTLSVVVSYLCPGFISAHAPFLLNGFTGAKEVIPALLAAGLLCSLGAAGLWWNHKLAARKESPESTK